ncbi:hypothetical protein [Tuwongella immobilis]|uniref:hypothetical protein n=1 Tax=Tuwongella immobilis TaxID=692036 RepID=UPI0013A6E27E|nr:hypothetical protein [Tuwongella immobilis]
MLLDPVLAKQIVPFQSQDLPFWTVLDQLAAQSDARVVIREQGRRIELVPGRSTGGAARVVGPIRILPTEIRSRLGLQDTASRYELLLEVACEPRFPLFRIDSHPRVLRAIASNGKAVQSPATNSRINLEGATATLTIPLEGVTREMVRLSEIEAEFRLTAANEWLTFDFTTAKRDGATPAQAGIALGMRQSRKQGTAWVIDFDYSRPEGEPAFESFEMQQLAPEWTLIRERDNAAFRPAERDFTEAGRGYRDRIRFDLEMLQLEAIPTTGWKLQARVSGPIREFPVRFRLENIPLP